MGVGQFLKFLFRKTTKSGFWLERAFDLHCLFLESEYSCKPEVVFSGYETIHTYILPSSNPENIFIQYTAPDEYYQRKGYYCIGYYYLDSLYLDPSKNWKSYLALMDEVWVPNTDLFNRISRIVKKVLVVPILPILENSNISSDRTVIDKSNSTGQKANNTENLLLSIKGSNSLLNFFRFVRMITRRKEKLSSIVSNIEFWLLKLLSKNKKFSFTNSICYTITDREFVKSGLTVLIKEFFLVKEKELIIIVIHSSIVELLEICYEISCLANQMKEKTFHILLGEESLYELLKNGNKNTLIYIPLFSGNYYYPYLSYLYKNHFIIPDHTAFKDIQTVLKVPTQSKFLDIKGLYTSYGYSNPVNIPKPGWLKDSLEKIHTSENTILPECVEFLQSLLKETWSRFMKEKRKE